jgi:hypothetical protein
VSSTVFYEFIQGIFVAVTAYRPFVQPSASNGFKKTWKQLTVVWLKAT